MALIQAYHYYGIRTIQSLQNVLEPTVPFFELLSLLTRPAIAYYFIFPVAFFMGPQIGLSVIWSATISEAISVFLKMMLYGERPYWWVEENSGKYQNFKIKQYGSTCEISPGTPSGHAFVTSAVLTTILLMWCNSEPKTCAKRSTKILSFITEALICISRVLIAAHFPHQVIFGALLGIFIAKILINHEMYKKSPISYFKMALFLLIFGVLSKYLFPKIGMCYCWAVTKAKKHCHNGALVPSCSQRPFHVYLKLASIIAGTGLSILIVTGLKNCKVKLQNCRIMRILPATLSLVITSFIFFKMNKYIVGGCTGLLLIILKNMIIPLSVIVFVPLLCGSYYN